MIKSKEKIKVLAAITGVVLAVGVFASVNYYKKNKVRDFNMSMLENPKESYVFDVDNGRYLFRDNKNDKLCLYVENENKTYEVHKPSHKYYEFVSADLNGDSMAIEESLKLEEGDMFYDAKKAKGYNAKLMYGKLDENKNKFIEKSDLTVSGTEYGIEYDMQGDKIAAVYRQDGDTRLYYKAQETNIFAGINSSEYDYERVAIYDDYISYNVIGKYKDGLSEMFNVNDVLNGSKMKNEINVEGLLTPVKVGDKIFALRKNDLVEYNPENSEITVVMSGNEYNINEYSKLYVVGDKILIASNLVYNENDSNREFDGIFDTQTETIQRIEGNGSINNVYENDGIINIESYENGNLVRNFGHI